MEENSIEYTLKQSCSATLELVDALIQSGPLSANQAADLGEVRREIRALVEQGAYSDLGLLFRLCACWADLSAIMGQALESLEDEGGAQEQEQVGEQASKRTIERADRRLAAIKLMGLALKQSRQVALHLSSIVGAFETIAQEEQQGQ